MAEQDRYLAGSFLAFSSPGKPIEEDARIFLVIEATSREKALDAAVGLIKSPKAIKDLLTTLSPWPSDTVIIDHEYLNRKCHVKGMAVEGEK